MPPTKPGRKSVPRTAKNLSEPDRRAARELLGVLADLRALVAKLDALAAAAVQAHYAGAEDRDAAKRRGNEAAWYRDTVLALFKTPRWITTGPAVEERAKQELVVRWAQMRAARARAWMESHRESLPRVSLVALAELRDLVSCAEIGRRWLPSPTDAELRRAVEMAATTLFADGGAKGTQVLLAEVAKVSPSTIDRASKRDGGGRLRLPRWLV